MDAVLHRIEALPADGGYVVTFLLGDGSQLTAIARLADGEVQLAETSLPDGWTSSEVVLALARAVQAVDHVRRVQPPAQLLRDVPGGWDVALGNVALGTAPSDATGNGAGDGRPNRAPVCTAHGEMPRVDGVHTCPTCGARALFG